MADAKIACHALAIPAFEPLHTRCLARQPNMLCFQLDLLKARRCSVLRKPSLQACGYGAKSVLLAERRYFFAGLVRHGYRVANNEINLRCNGGALVARCLKYIEYMLVKTGEQGCIITGPP